MCLEVSWRNASVVFAPFAAPYTCSTLRRHGSEHQKQASSSAEVYASRLFLTLRS
jgi:hypothetical protein